jgi:hypothetical protein
MKIVHLCLSVYYVDHFRYQENYLIERDKLSGHDVIVIASTETFDKSGNRIYVEPTNYLNNNAVPIYRIPYFFGNNFFSYKIRKYKGVISLLEKYQPDVIFFHGACAWEILKVSDFVRKNPHIKFFIDSHEDWNNSARSWLSREILHKLVYRPVLQSAINVCEKLLCISTETMDFMKNFYVINPSKLEFYPLAGEPLLDLEYEQRRRKKRESYGISNFTRVFVQIGKQTHDKRLIDSLRAFKLAAHKDCLFLIAGSISPEIQSEVMKLIEADTRIRFLGWCNSEELTDLLCVADVYVQPGTQSATMQHSLCCRCAVILADVPSHTFYNCNNGWFVNEQSNLFAAFRDACNNDLEERKQRSFEFANKYLNYERLSKRYTGEPYF